MYKSFKDKLKANNSLKSSGKKTEKEKISINDVINGKNTGQQKTIKKYDLEKELNSEKNQGFLSLNIIKEINVTED